MECEGHPDAVDKAVAWDELATKNAEIAKLRDQLVKMKDSLLRISDAWETFKEHELQLDEGVEQSIEAGREVLRIFTLPDEKNT